MQFSQLSSVAQVRVPLSTARESAATLWFSRLLYPAWCVPAKSRESGDGKEDLPLLRMWGHPWSVILRRCALVLWLIKVCCLTLGGLNADGTTQRWVHKWPNQAATAKSTPDNGDNKGWLIKKGGANTARLTGCNASLCRQNLWTSRNESKKPNQKKHQGDANKKGQSQEGGWTQLQSQAQKDKWACDC